MAPALIAVGDLVTVGSTSATLLSGTVRYIGVTQFAAGEWLGLELSFPGGKNNGTIKGVRYFDCPDKFGVFVRQSTVKKVETKTAVTSPVAAGTRSSIGAAKKSGGSTPTGGGRGSVEVGDGGGGGGGVGGVGGGGQARSEAAPAPMVRVSTEEATMKKDRDANAAAFETEWALLFEERMLQVNEMEGVRAALSRITARAKVAAARAEAAERADAAASSPAEERSEAVAVATAVQLERRVLAGLGTRLSGLDCLVESTAKAATQAAIGPAAQDFALAIADMKKKRFHGSRS